MLELNFRPFPDLQTARLHLWRLSETDVAPLFEMRSDPLAMQHIGKPLARNQEEILGLIRNILALEDRKESITWTITFLGSDELTGTVCLWNIQPEDHRAEVGHMLSPKFWNQGIMKEVLAAVIPFGFYQMKLNSIEAQVNPANIASAIVLEKSGSRKEGQLRENRFFDGKYTDTAFYGLLKKEYETTAATTEFRQRVV